MSGPIWILSGVRTPFAKAGGPFRDTPVYELGRIAVGEVVACDQLADGDPPQLVDRGVAEHRARLGERGADAAENPAGRSAHARGRSAGRVMA